MGVETLGEAYMLGWRIHVRCAWWVPSGQFGLSSSKNVEAEKLKGKTAG
jgi:hypothetical protein